MMDFFLWKLNNILWRPKSRKQRSARRGWVYSEILFRDIFWMPSKTTQDVGGWDYSLRATWFVQLGCGKNGLTLRELNLMFSLTTLLMTMTIIFTSCNEILLCVREQNFTDLRCVYRVSVNRRPCSYRRN